jgi:hypothetical protein
MALSADEIDTLLRHYLVLLDTYTTLRTRLTALQASVNQQIARANFTSERGRRYGQDDYDDRMQASIQLVIAEGSSFTISKTTEESVKEKDPKPQEGKDAGDTDEKEAEQLDGEKQKRKKKNDPLRQFGVLVPQALRLAQSEAEKMVMEIVPQLVSVDQEMREVEIQVRRARKYTAKAESRARKEALHDSVSKAVST